ncbi:hypothetical protein [Winogradskyella thalassocola]|uniref:Tellurite resistance protein TerB n=1 Tax=Winogradskyella thalassocola TaxID=262004 RepID=A0A1G8BH39_9FLAO|nr:hypothetical protein [Winogradskyella thalassocola]SDH32333.1 hypothetical protein SAMN04489796_102327 [Winogradskyella thalassocola]
MNQKSHIEFYRRLGHLFFAIAATDNCVRDEEFKTLQTIIYKDWLSLNEDAKYILETFNELQSNEEHNPMTCFQRFVDFKRAHPTLFDTTISSKILKTASAITTSFSGQNKSELILLAKLDLELKKK